VTLYELYNAVYLYHVEWKRRGTMQHSLSDPALGAQITGESPPIGSHLDGWQPYDKKGDTSTSTLRSTGEGANT
jgi:hypothetical protein